MYHPAVVRARLTQIADYTRTFDPTFTFRDYSLGQVEEWIARLDTLYDEEKGVLRRGLNPDEERFVYHEINKAKADATYWLTHYGWIKTKAQTLSRITLLESQEIALRTIAARELECVRQPGGDGIVLMILKARQLGMSTLVEGLISHRVFFYPYTGALVAADVPTQSAYLFDMLERFHANLPWWMKPARTHHVKDQEMYFGDLDTLILVQSGKSTRGGATLGLERGQMGRGQTWPLFHGSELSTWENPDQIDDSLMPSIPETPLTLAVFESTGRGRGNWWHDAWLAARKGVGRRRPVFIPWYAERHTYSRPAPSSWSPSPLALAHAAKVLETSARWCGRSVTLNRDQLYWWEMTRADYAERKKLHLFLAEYAADDLEAFQATSLSVFPHDTINEQRQMARPTAGLVEFRPRMGA